MQSNIRSVAKEFVDLVVKYQNWSKVTWLHIDDLNILLATVRAAGFYARAVRKGRVIGHSRDWHGIEIGEIYYMNSTCPFKVVAEDGSDHRLATIWLESTLRNISTRYEEEGAALNALVALVAVIVEDSIPLEPILMTSEDDYLREYTLKNGIHIRDVDDVDFCAGIHDNCGGWLKRRGKNRTHDQIICTGCFLRVPFPKEVRSYGELRKYFKEALAARPSLLDMFFDWIPQLW